MRLAFLAMHHSEKHFLVLDLNGLLIKRYRICHSQGNLGGFAKLASSFVYKVFTPNRDRGKAQTEYVIRPNVVVFLQFASAQFHLTIWTSCTKENAKEVMCECFSRLFSKIKYHMKGHDF